MPSQSGAGFTLPGVASDGADGLAVAGGLTLEGATYNAARPVQLEPGSYFVEADGYWHLPALGVGGNDESAAGSTYLNVGGILEVVGGSNVVRFTGLSSLDGNFTYGNGVASVESFQASTELILMLDGQVALPLRVMSSGFATLLSVGLDGSLTTVADVIAATGKVEAATLQLVPTAGSGAPSTGTHTKGEVVMDSAGALFVCQATGTPGTWKTVTLT